MIQTGSWAISVMAGLLLVACSPATADDARGTASSTPQPVRYGPMDSVPAAFLGTWVRVREECEPDSGEVPRTDLPPRRITFARDFRYVMVDDGVETRGRFRVEQLQDGQRLTLIGDVPLNFSLEAGMLSNWSEGDAVYLCGQVHERVPG